MFCQPADLLEMCRPGDGDGVGTQRHSSIRTRCFSARLRYVRIQVKKNLASWIGVRLGWAGDSVIAMFTHPNKANGTRREWRCRRSILLLISLFIATQNRGCVMGFCAGLVGGLAWQ